MPDVDGQVRPERRADDAAPSGVANLPMELERVGGRIGRAEHFDLEALEERPGPELGTPQARVDSIVDAHRRRARQRLVDAEDALELVRQPGAARRAAEQIEVVREPLPDRARIGFDRAAVEPWDAERLHRHALRVEHADDVVIRDDDQRCRVREGLVERQQLRIDVAMRADERQRSEFVVQRLRGGAHGGNRTEVAVGSEHGASISPPAPAQLVRATRGTGSPRCAPSAGASARRDCLRRTAEAGR